MDVNENDFALNKSEIENIYLKKELKELKSLLNNIAEQMGSAVVENSNLESGFYSQVKRSDGYISYRPDYHGMVDYIIKEHHLISSEAYAYIFKNNYYQYIGPLGICHMMTGISKGKVQPNHLDAFRKLLLAKSYGREKLLRPIEGLINLTNGILNVKTRELIPNSEKYFFKYKLPHKYDPSATCPRFLKFLNYIFFEDQSCLKVISEMFGYCLLGGTPFLHKSFILYGEGRNGKSTLLDILEALLGFDNVSKVSLMNLNKPFSAVNLDGRLANIVNEGPSDRINAEAFKTAVGGGTLTGAHKGKPEYDVQCNCRFICATNSIPKFNETSSGVKERLYFLKFDRIIAETDRDPHIARFIIENELPGILNFALDGLGSLLKRGFMTPNLGHTEVMQEFKAESDSVYEFYENKLTVDPNGKNIIFTDTIYDSYKHFCERISRKPVSIIPFSRRLTSILKSEHEIDLRSRSNKKRGFLGLSLQSDLLI